VKRTDVWDIVMEYMPVAAQALKRAGCPVHQLEEMTHDVGIPAILRCLERYDATKAAFSTYLWHAVRRAWWRETKRKLLQIEVEQCYDDNPERERRDMVQYIMEGLDTHDRLLLELRFWHGFTYSELAATLKMPRASLHRYLTDLLKRCRDAIT